MGRRSRKRKPKVIPLKKGKIQEISVEKSRYSVRKYETCHNQFLDYQGIKEYLCKIQRNYPNKVQLQTIGRTSGGKSIFMVIISSGRGKTEQPKMATMIEAGSNGDEWMTISTALFMIDFLAKNEHLVKIMDYFIIPCSNPDAYECSLNKSRKSDVSMSLSNNFPVILGTCDMKSIDTDDFLKGLRRWKENYKFNSLETIAVIKTIATYQFAIKLFISLQGNGTAITYPFGFCPGKCMDFEELKQVAKAGQHGFKCRCAQVGSICEVNGLTYGTIIDFLMANRSSIKFLYIVQVNKQDKLDVGKILCYGQETMNCVRFMARNVYMFYTKKVIKSDCKSFSLFIF